MLIEITLAIYGLACVYLTYLWLSIKPSLKANTVDQISVIIPVKNEENNILNLLNDLSKQSLPHNRIEILIANDNSTDRTASMVREFQQKSSLAIRLIDLPAVKNNASPKKRAIQYCIALATGSIIVATDGDCRVGTDWLASHLAAYSDPKINFVSAPIFFKSTSKNESFFRKIWYAFQEIEFGSLILAGAASIQAKSPNMCSGANLSYRKESFTMVNGFAGNENLASGDDEFLMHKIHVNFPDSVAYLKDKRATVFTEPVASFSGFYHQRKRWASKWTSYQITAPKIVAIFIFLSNFTFLVALFKLSFWGILFKIIPEFIYLLVGLKFMNNLKKVAYIFPLQLIYPFYVIFFGINSLFSTTYFWKNQTLK